MTFAKRFAAFVLALVLDFGYFPMASLEVFGEETEKVWVTVDDGVGIEVEKLQTDGDGNYIINNAAQWLLFVKMVNEEFDKDDVNSVDMDAKVAAGAEIDFSKITNWSGGLSKDAISALMLGGKEPNKRYIGTFDGNGCIVKGFRIADTLQRKVSLFCYLGEGGIIKNINIEDIYIDTKTSGNNVAGILYQNNGGIVSNCHIIYGSITTTQGNGAAGIVYENNSGTVEKCSNSATIEGSKNVGGIVGTGSGGEVKNCWNRGSIKSTTADRGTTSGAAGIIGCNNGAMTAKNCYNIGEIFGTRYAQPLVGNDTKTSPGDCITDCYSLENTVTNDKYSDELYYGKNSSGEAITGGYSQAAFTSGEIAYLLSHGEGKGVWGQTVGTDSSPVLGGKAVVYENGIYKNADTNPTPPQPKASIVLEGGVPSFADLEFGYENPAEAVFNFVNNGNADADEITAVLTEGNDVFTLECTEKSCISSGKFTVKVKPLTGLLTGEYEGKIEISWKDCTAPLTFEFVQKVTEVKPSLTVDIAGWTYGDKPNSPTWNYGGDPLAVPKIEYRAKEESTYTEDVPKNAGDYVVRISFLSVPGYEDAVEAKEFSVAKRKVTPVVIGKAEMVFCNSDIYNGNALSISLSNAVEGDNIDASAEDYIFDSAARGENKTVTAYGIKLSGSAKDNYELTAETATAIGKITKANPEITWPSFTDIHVGTKLSDITLGEGFTWDNPETAAMDGEHEYPATFTPKDTESYNTLNGNISVTAYDKTPPTGIIAVGENTWCSKITHDKVKFNTYYNAEQTVTITGIDAESGIRGIQYSVRKYQTANMNDIDNWTEYSEPFTVSAEGENIIYVRVTSEAGVFIDINTDGFIIDTVAPVISGVTEGETYCEAQNFTVDDGTAIVKINGVETVSRVLNADGAKIITATDKAGNCATVKVTVNNGHTAKYIAKDKTIEEECLYCGTKIGSVSIKAPTENLVYTGLEHKAEIIGESEYLAENEFAIEYFRNGEKVTSTAPAGKYIAIMSSPDGKTSVSTSFEIAKARLEVKANDSEIGYGEEAKQNGVTYIGFVNGEDEAVLGGKLCYEFPLYEKFSDADKYLIKPSGLTSDNYKIVFMTGDLTVKPLLATVNWTSLSDEELIYDGESKTVTAKVVNTVNGDDVKVEVIPIGDNRNVTEEGFYFTAAALDSKNYVLSENETSAVYKIKKADPKPNWPEGFAIASGKQLKDITLANGFTWDIPETAITYGEHEFKVTYTPEDIGNYNVLTKNIPVYGNDITPPSGKVTVGTNNWNSLLSEITFGIFFSKTQEVIITAEDSESGVAKIEYYLAKEKTESFETVEWTEYKAPLNVDPDKKFIIYAKITDNAGVSAIINSNGIIVETAASVVPGIETGKEYFGEAVFEIPKEYDVTVILDGEIIIRGSFASKLKEAGAGAHKIVIPADNKEHTLEIIDSVGNKTEFKVTVYKNYTVTFVADGVTLDTQTVGYGKYAEAPAIPEKAGYTAKGWDKPYENITEDTVVTAVYEKNASKPAAPSLNKDSTANFDREEENPNTGYGA